MPPKITQISGLLKLDTQTFTLSLNENNKKKKLNAIINIALNNGCRKNIIHIYKQRQNKPENNAEK
jgi:hypothetical protein